MIFVVMWRWHDNGAFELIRAFSVQADAERLCGMFKAHGDTSKAYEVVQVALDHDA